MPETLLLTVQITGQAGEDLLISPTLPADNYDLDEIQKVKVVTPDRRVFEKEATFSILLGVPVRVYMLLMPNTRQAEVPAGSQIWVGKTPEEIARPH